MTALFLLQVAKQTDIEFKIPQQSSGHTVREAAGDIWRMVHHMLEHRVTTEHREGGTPFSNPITKGAEKIAGGIIQNYISKTIEIEGSTETVPDIDEIDLSYELHNIY